MTHTLRPGCAVYWTHQKTGETVYGQIQRIEANGKARVLTRRQLLQPPILTRPQLVPLALLQHSRDTELYHRSASDVGVRGWSKAAGERTGWRR